MAEPKVFSISRIVDAPQDLIWKAWTQKEHLVKWFGPQGVTLTYSDMDFRPGGYLHSCMKTPDGAEMWGKLIYQEIHPIDRLVYITTFSDKSGGLTRHPLSPSWPLEMLTTITLAAENGKTKVTVGWKPINASAEEIATFNMAYDGMTQGWTGTFDQLTAYLADIQR